jgi:sulfopyruvate decarboxylase alpha subunit
MVARLRKACESVGRSPKKESAMAQAADKRAWHEIVRDVLKRHEVKLVNYVPDNVLKPLIKTLEEDPYFTIFSTTREEEAMGILAGAYMAGTRGILLMQTSGFATLPNVIASLQVPYQIPTLMMVSERGTLGEFNIGQAMVARTMRPVLDALAIETHTMTRHDEAEFILDRSMVQAWATKMPCCYILSPLLTGGKVFEA